MFNIHVLSTGESFFYAYDETVARKGADEVSSFLFYFVMVQLDPAVKELDIFCDSCGGQNKNWTLFRLVHYIVHHTKRLEKVKMNFPIRGHSYLECDRNMACVNQNKWVELPTDWIEEFEVARAKPSPFRVVEVDRQLVRKWTEYLDQRYFKKNPFKSRPVRELIALNKHPRMLQYRSTYHGHWDGHVINEPGSLPPSDGPKLPQGEFTLPEVAYQDALPIPYEKFKDLQQLKKFCGEEARTFYSQLPKMAPGEKSKKKDRKNRIEIVFPNVVKIQKAVQRKSL
uniref:Uncharacterized protein n=1 Tax=Timema tahoe TaxID=61484 RepID=A0A7R9INZ6_9NEOP|nr:unnamed protein product [Timema tahoe]CAD7461930.1 unnamed protein product [Timema tahoe]